MRNRDARPNTTTGGSVEPLERLVAEMELLGALRFDGGGRVITCNATMARLLGCSPGELTGVPLGQVLDAPDAAAMLALVRGGHSHMAGRVRLAFLGRARDPLVLECAVAVDGSGGALLGSRPHRGQGTDPQ
jgi:PAS domain-containing protein